MCLDTPTSRATSSTLRPASNCFKAAIISASVCFPLDMPPLFFWSLARPKRGETFELTELAFHILLKFGPLASLMTRITANE